MENIKWKTKEKDMFSKYTETGKQTHIYKYVYLYLDHSEIYLLKIMKERSVRKLRLESDQNKRE